MASAGGSSKRKPNVVYSCLAEGTVTEPLYIDFIKGILRKEGAPVVIRKIRTDKTEPKNLLKRAQTLSKEVKNREHICIICDTDGRKGCIFDDIKKWVDKDPVYRHAAITDPFFEAWLLLHFENISARDKREILEALVGWGVYSEPKSKEPNMSLFSMENVRDAIARAQSLERSTGDVVGIARLIDQWFSFIKKR